MPAVPPLHPGPTRFEGGLTEIGPGVHAWLQPNGLLGESNAGLVIGDGASLLVDTLWDRRLTRRMLAAMAPLIRDAPIETLVNTHSDADHWWGNQEVQGAEIIAALRRVGGCSADRGLDAVSLSAAWRRRRDRRLRQ